MTATNEATLKLAREIAANLYSRIRDHDYAQWVLNGEKDSDNLVQIALAAIEKTTELAAALIDQANHEGPYNAIGCASRLRSYAHLKGPDDE